MSRRGPQGVAVIADSLWKRRFAASPAILDKPVRVGAVSLRIVGVAPPGFFGETGRAELWTPISMAPLMGKSESALTARNRHWDEVAGRLKPGVTRGQAVGPPRARPPCPERSRRWFRKPSRPTYPGHKPPAIGTIG
jgi:hypothetical protein